MIIGKIKTRKREKKKMKVMIIREKLEKTAKKKLKFHGEELLGPQIILGRKLICPQARLRIPPIARFEPATSMTSPALVARLRIR